MTRVSIAFTKEMMAKMLARFRALIGSEQTRPTSIKIVEEELPGFSRQLLGRLYDLAAGKTIPNDFTKDDLKSIKAVADQTFELVFKKPRPEFMRGSIVRFLGTEWWVRVGTESRLQINRLV
jgi:hypothetical protein